MDPNAVPYAHQQHVPVFADRDPNIDDDDAPQKPRKIYLPHQNQYPSVVVHPTKGKKVVQSKEEHDALGAGWEFPGHEAPPEKTKPAPQVDLSDEIDQLFTALEDRVAQLEAAIVKAMASGEKKGK